jgi:hypothetical protein
MRWVGGIFHGPLRSSNACARTVTFLHIAVNLVTGEIPPSIDEVRKRLIGYGHGAFLWTTGNHQPSRPDYVVGLPWGALGLFPHGPNNKDQAAVAEQHAAAVYLDARRAIAIAKELGIDGVLAVDCGRITALIPPATHLPESSEWIAEWIAGRPIDQCMAIIDSKAQKLRPSQPQHAHLAYDYIIDIYNKKFALTDQLAMYGYQAVTAGRWLSPNQASNSPAVSILQDGERWVSFSGSDMAVGVGSNARSGVRWGDSFSLLKHYECEGRHYRALRLAARRCGLAPPPRRGLPRLAMSPLPELRGPTRSNDDE